jgi:hypothetical protein
VHYMGGVRGDRHAGESRRWRDGMFEDRILVLTLCGCNQAEPFPRPPFRFGQQSMGYLSG